MILNIKYLENYDKRWGELKFSKGNSAVDLRAAIKEPILIHPGERVVIPTGISVELISDLHGEIKRRNIPMTEVSVHDRYSIEVEEDTIELQVRPRSGLSARQGLVNVIGTIDSSYRGEIGAIVYNLNQAIIPDYSTMNKLPDDYENPNDPIPVIYNKNSEVVINPGDRIAQLIVSKILKPQIIESNNLSETSRGEKGFGSSGVK